MRCRIKRDTLDTPQQRLAFASKCKPAGGHNHELLENEAAETMADKNDRSLASCQS